MSERNLATVQRFWDAINRGDVDAYLDTFTSTAGDRVKIEGIDIYRHAQDGRIEEMWGYFQA